MNTKHTPGPWYATNAAGDAQGLVIAETTGANIAVTYRPEDAALVAAAPDLLSILSRILAAHDTQNNGAVMGEAVLCEHFARLARATLAKVTEG